VLVHESIHGEPAPLVPKKIRLKVKINLKNYLHLVRRNTDKKGQGGTRARRMRDKEG
jgi:hypothetical protein